MNDSSKDREDLLAHSLSSAPAINPLSLTELRDLPAAAPLGVTGPGAGLSSTPGVRLAETPGGEGEPRPAGLVPGDVLADRYEIRRLLGSGGMGAVFAAYDRLRQEEIAVKVLHAALLADPKARERFIQEATLASGLAHPRSSRSSTWSRPASTPLYLRERGRG